MKWLLLPLVAFALTSCDRFSQRIWNCSSGPLPVTKVLDTGEQINDVIPSRNYIGSMKGGVQVVALQEGRRIIWERGEVTKGFAASADNACQYRHEGIVAEQI